MNYVSKIEVKVAEASQMQEMLNIKEGACKECPTDGVLNTYTSIFPNGFVADIKVCNGDTPFVDAVLFDEQGCEVSVLEVSDTLLGEYLFEFEDDTYEVTVEPSDENAQVTMYEKSHKGVSLFSGEPVAVIAERTTEVDGKVLEQYLYNIVGYEAKNGKPFVSLKANISLE